MAREYMERMAYQEMQRAAMRTAHSESPVGGATSAPPVQPDVFQDIINNMKRKFSVNLEHYSNVLSGMMTPQVRRRNRRTSSNSSTDGNNVEISGCGLNYMEPHSPAMEVTEEFELLELDGSVFDFPANGRVKLGVGHNFISNQLRNPTWCDSCGEFIWGVYKQCLKCKNEDGFLRHNLRSRPATATAAHRTRSYEPPPSSADTYEPGHSDYGTGDTGYFSQISNGSKISDSSRCPRHAPASTSGSRSPRYSRDMEDVLGDEDDDMETSSQSTLERIQKKAEKYEKNYDSPVKRRLRQKEKKESDKTNRSSLRWSQVFRDLDGALSDLDSLIDIGSQLENRLRDSDDSDVEETPVSSLERTYKDFDRELDRLTGRHSPRRLDSESTREYYERLLLASCYDDEEKNDRLVHNSRTDHNSRDYHNPPRDSRDFHDSRDSRDFHDYRDYHSPRDSLDFHDSRDNHDSHVSRDNPRTTTDRAHCDCNFTCHHRCRQQVTLDCQDPGRREKWTPERASNSAETSFQENGAGSCIPQPDFDDDDTSSGYQTAHSDFLPRASVAAHDADLRRRHLAAAARPPRPNSSDDSFQDDDEDNDSGYQTAKSHLNPAAQQSFSNDELIKRIEVYNQLNQGHTIMWFDDDSSGITFQGFVRVNMNLMRPINMSLAHRPPSIYEVLAHENTEDFLTANCNTHTTSFYLPKDTVKALHISSETTTQEVIVMLLQKFKITDNPRKFALYEHTVFKDNKSHMRKMSDEERPLRLTLTWLGGDWGRKKLVLQENDSGEIVWEAFSLPELENFLKILNREEQEYAEQVKLKYRLLRLQMQQHSKELIPSPAGESGEGEDASSSISQTVEQDNRTPVFV